MVEALTRTTHTAEGGREETGFWLPVRPGWRKDEGKLLIHGKEADSHLGTAFLVWCEQREDFGEEDGYDRFLGCLTIGNVPYHLNVVRLIDNDVWEVEGEDGHPFPHDTDMGRPITFKVDGYEGEWVIMGTPYS